MSRDFYEGWFVGAVLMWIVRDLKAWADRRWL